MRKQDIHGDTPNADPDDDLELRVVDHPYSFAEFSENSDTLALIVEAINRMGGSGESAENAYQRCLAQLAVEATLVVDIIQTEYFGMSETDYLDRWALVMLLVEVENEESVNFFNAVIENDIPKEKSEDPHSFSTVGEEIMIRTTAIEGLERLAANGSEAATEALFKYIVHESFSIRRAATQALIATNGEKIRNQLFKDMPEQFHDVLAIRRTNVRDVEQAEGGLFLKGHDSDELPPPREINHDK